MKILLSFLPLANPADMPWPLMLAGVLCFMGTVLFGLWSALHGLTTWESDSEWAAKDRYLGPEEDEPVVLDLPVLIDEFTAIAERAFDSIPQEYKDRLDDTPVVIEVRPSREALLAAGVNPDTSTAAGMFSQMAWFRKQGNPDPGAARRITLYYEPIVHGTPTDKLEEAVRGVLIHEIGHAFGFDHEHLAEHGY